MKFKSKFLIAPILAASLAMAPFTSADAYWRHGGGGGGHFGRGFGIGAAVGGLLVGTALLVTAPIRAVGDAIAAPAPGYYEPPQQQQAYYQPQQQAYYAPPPRPVYTREYVEAPPAYYYAPAPRYYHPYYGGY